MKVNPYCSAADSSGIVTGYHNGAAIGYEKVQEGPTFEQRGDSLAITQGAYYRYFVVRACRKCPAVWWEEHVPVIPQRAGAVT